MKFAIMSAVAAGALSLSAGTASAQFFGPSYYGGGTAVTIGRPGGIGITIGSGGGYSSYYRGYGYGGYGGYRPYYGGYNNYYNRPYYGGGYNSYYSRPYYGGYGYRGWNGRRW